MAWCSALAVPGEFGRCTCGLSGCSDWPGGGGRRPSPWVGGDSRERKWPAEGACESEAMRPLESGMERFADGGGR